MRQGNFSELLNPNNIFYGQTRIVTDPTTGQPFQGNIIPQNRLSKNGLALLNIFPAPNVNASNQNYQQFGAAPENQRKDTGSLDFVPDDKNYIRFRVLNYEYNNVNPFSSNYGVIPQLFNRPNQTVSLNWTNNVSPTVVNEFVVSASRDQTYINIDQSNGLYNRNNYGVNYPYLFPTGKNIPGQDSFCSVGRPFYERIERSALSLRIEGSHLRHLGQRN